MSVIRDDLAFRLVVHHKVVCGKYIIFKAFQESSKNELFKAVFDGNS